MLVSAGGGMCGLDFRQESMRFDAVEQPGLVS